MIVNVQRVAQIVILTAILVLTAGSSYATRAEIGRLEARITVAEITERRLDRIDRRLDDIEEATGQILLLLRPAD